MPTDQTDVKEKPKDPKRKVPKKVVFFCFCLLLTALYIHFGMLGKYDVSVHTSAAYVAGDTVTISGTISGEDTEALTLTDTCGDLSDLAWTGTNFLATRTAGPVGTCTVTASYHDAIATVTYTVHSDGSLDDSDTSPPQGVPKDILKLTVARRQLSNEKEET